MDQSRYWIQKEGTCLNSHAALFGDSWEEQAFAEDAAGPLGGCIWPPRSYTCSFCRREFRSAQALGGHMNVHRRDRAKLKQISSGSTSNTTANRSCVLQNPSEICNPNFDLFSSSNNSPTPSILRPFTCSFTQEQQKLTTPAALLSWSVLEPRKRFHRQDSDTAAGCATATKDVESNISKTNNHQIEVHFTGKLVRKRCESTTPIFNDGLMFKKRRIDDGAHYLFPKNSKSVNSEEVVVTHERSPNSTLENLDLELRLGDRP